MEQDPAHLAAHGITVAVAQILDLLGKVLAVEAVVAGAQGAQHLGLVLGPGVEIIVVIRPLWARSVRHRSHSLVWPRQYIRSSPLGGAPCQDASPGFAKPLARRKKEAIRPTVALGMASATLC